MDEQVGNLRSIELEALQQKHYVMKHHRIGLLGQQLDRVKEEIGKRDLASVPTEKLFDIFGKFATALKQEEFPVVF